ncbi:MAG TPA: META domain-containing protein [Chitinophagaceae bacterium]|nr:META domain-containing protein [Chitinophagaceae bacterium]
MKLITYMSTGLFMLLSAFIMKKDNWQHQSLYENKWSLKKIYTKRGTEEVNTKAFIKFNQQRQSAGGNGSCNTFGSSLIVNGDKISFKDIFSTKMYCEGLQQTEDKFFQQLNKINRFEIKDQTLLLLRDDEVLLEFQSE